MINFRSMFNSVFNKPEIKQNFTNFKLLNSYTDSHFPTTSNVYDDATVRSCIHAIASNAAKLKPKHIRKIDGKIIENADKSLEKLLSTRPNAYMNAYDFYYKVISQLYLHNNALIYVQTAGGKITGLFPILYSSFELKEANNELYCKFQFGNGEQITLLYSSIIHLRRFYCNNEFFGDDTTASLKFNLDLLNTCKQGLKNAIQKSGVLRGILKFAGNLNPTDLEKEQKRFADKYLTLGNTTSIAALGMNTEFQQLNTDLKLAETEQFEFFKNEIMKFFGVNEKILNSNYTENEWNAFYESVIEPIAVQLSLEFTSKLFTEREKGHGNEIVFEANRLQYSSADTKYKMIKDLMPLGILSVNEAREILNLAAVEGGEKRQVSLNYVDADKQNQYQVGENKNKEEINEED